MAYTFQTSKKIHDCQYTITWCLEAKTDAPTLQVHNVLIENLTTGNKQWWNRLFPRSMNTVFNFSELESVVTALEWAEAREQLQKDLRLLNCVWCTEQKAEDGERTCESCKNIPYMERVAR